MLPVCGAMILASLSAQPCGAQSSVSHPPTVPPITQRLGESGVLTDSPPPVDERLLRARNADRQRSLVSDTNKLLLLVNELNAEIARANTGSLTPEQLRKVAEIEKLAHNVKEKMSTSVRGTPSFQPAFQPVHY